MGTSFGRGLFGRELFAFDTSLAAPIEQTIPPREYYHLEVHGKNGGLKAILRNWIKAMWTTELNKPSVLQMVYPWADEHSLFLDFPNLLYLRDGEGQLLGRFRILNVERRMDKSGMILLGITAYDMLAQLGAEDITTYAETKTVSQHVSALLDLQQISYFDKVTYGSVTGVAATSVQISRGPSSILQILHELRKQVGGFFYVDGNRQFRWKTEGSVGAGRQIRVDKNLTDFAEKKDYHNLRTKLILYGKGVGTERVSVTKTNLGSYGTIQTSRVASNIETETELGALGDQMIASLSEVKKEYKIGVIDLSQAEGFMDFQHESFQVGDRRKVLVEQFNLLFNTRISKIGRDLADPMQIQCQVVDPSWVLDEVDVEASPGDEPTETQEMEPHETFESFLVDMFERQNDYALSDFTPESLADFLVGSPTAVTTLENALSPFTIHVAANKAALPTPSAPALGYTTSDQQYWGRVSSDWEPLLRFTA